MSKKFLNKADFTSSTSKALVELFVPKLNGVVFIKHITVQQRNNLLSWAIEYDSAGKARAIPTKPSDTALGLLRDSIVDQDGKPIFTLEDLNNLSAEMSDVIDLLFEESNKINVLTAVSAKEIEKN